VSLTTREACAVNDVLTHLFGRGPTDDTPLPAARDVRDSIAVLAGVAHRKIGSGWTLAQAVRATNEMVVHAVNEILAAPDGETAEFAAQVTRAIVSRCDGDDLAIDGIDAQPWAADRPDEPDLDDELILTHPSGRQVRVRIRVEVIEGTLS
jgi:hypothetical protein